MEPVKRPEANKVLSFVRCQFTSTPEDILSLLRNLTTDNIEFPFQLENKQLSNLGVDIITRFQKATNFVDAKSMDITTVYNTLKICVVMGDKACQTYSV